MAATFAIPAFRIDATANGTLLTPDEFDRAEFERGPCYELIHGVLIVSPWPTRSERDPNDELGFLLRNYQTNHPQGSVLDVTLPDETIAVGEDRRRPDRVIYAGLGRLPAPDETPTIVVEFVSAGRRNFVRDYNEKRREYLALGVREYWIIDRFARTMTVSTNDNSATTTRVYLPNEVYATLLLPGFELPLARLFDLADRWNQPVE